MPFPARAIPTVSSFSRLLVRKAQSRPFCSFSVLDINVKRDLGRSKRPSESKLLSQGPLNLHQYFSMDLQRQASISGGVDGSESLPHRQHLEGVVTSPSDPVSEGAKGPQSPKSAKPGHNKAGSISSNKQEPQQQQPQKPDGAAKAAEATGKSSQASADLPDFIIHRNQIFDELKKKHDTEVQRKSRPEIDVVLDLGRDKNGVPRPPMPLKAKAWESTPGSFLRHVDKEISSDVVVAKVDGKELWDLDRPLEYGCRVSYVPFTSPEGRNVFWHSSAHVLGEAAECQYNCLLSHGPPVEQGFFYDMAIADG